MRIEIKTISVRQKSGVGKDSGKAYSFQLQTAYAHLDGKPYPTEFELAIDDGKPPYGIGFYTINPKSYYVDKFKNLALSTSLVPELVK